MKIQVSSLKRANEKGNLQIQDCNIKGIQIKATYINYNIADHDVVTLKNQQPLPASSSFLYIYVTEQEHFHNQILLISKMTSYYKISKALIVLCLSCIVLITQAQSRTWSFLQAPKEITLKLIRDPVTLSLASTDYGHIVHDNPFAIFAPSSISDISLLINFSNSLAIPITIAPRGQAHSVHGRQRIQKKQSRSMVPSTNTSKQSLNIQKNTK